MFTYNPKKRYTFSKLFKRVTYILYNRTHTNLYTFKRQSNLKPLHMPFYEIKQSSSVFQYTMAYFVRKAIYEWQMNLTDPKLNEKIPDKIHKEKIYIQSAHKIYGEKAKIRILGNKCRYTIKSKSQNHWNMLLEFDPNWRFLVCKVPFFPIELIKLEAFSNFFRFTSHLIVSTFYEIQRNASENLPFDPEHC